MRFGPGRLEEEADELWRTAEEVRREWRSPVHVRNADACIPYGLPCPYLPICSGAVQPGPPQYRRCERLHPKLAGSLDADDDPRTLTPSRVRCFRLCRRKHHYRYELGIEPARGIPGESFFVGWLVRQAVTAWWGYFLARA